MEIITCDEVKKRMEEGEKLHLLDVREAEEVAEFNIGGVHLSLNKIQGMETEDIDDLKNEEVICYCRSGSRSMMAAMVLEQMGFRNTKNLQGGMLEWKEKLKG